MDRFTHIVTERCRLIVVLTFVLLAICGVLATFVPVNYNLVSYLPEESESTVALDVMSEEFGNVTSARVMVDDASIEQALAVKERIEEAPGVTSVMWLDDVIDVETPLETADQTLVDTYYKDGHALFTVTIESGLESEAVNAIYDIIGEANHATGEAVTTAESKAMTGSEVANAFIILIPLILALLILSSHSWIEPVFFLLAIGVSIVLNLGTNIFLGEVSYIAYTIAPILQLAVSLDYAIFLIHAFQRARERESDPKVAMRAAMRESFSSVAASAMTTVFGFAALGFMQFGIGADLGITLVKGVLLSFACVMVFLPAFALLCCRAIDKTEHRRFMPSFKNVGRVLRPIRFPVLALVAVLIVPCVLAQSSMGFLYGMGSSEGSQTRGAIDQAAIEDVYGAEVQLVALVPRGDVGAEAQLAADLEQIPEVKSVMSYASSVGADIPAEFLDSAIVDQFYSENYARIVLYCDMAKEGDEAFAVVDEVRAAIAQYYGDEGLVAGEPANLYDMKVVTAVDSTVTNAIAIIAILLVIAVTFRSLLLPFVLVATIESAICINLAVPYFVNDPINYLGFLVINTVQLGATVDYAILFTDTYRRYRQTMPVREALMRTWGETFKSVLISACILAFAGFVLWLTSSNNIVSILGLLLFRGTLLSLFLVVTMLPALLGLLDRPIAKLTWRSGFFYPEKAKKAKRAGVRGTPAVADGAAEALAASGSAGSGSDGAAKRFADGEGDGRS